MTDTLVANATQTGERTRLPTWLCIGYGAGMIGGQIFRDTPALLLLPFMTNTLDVPAAMAGLAIFIPKFWVVFADPLAGIASDRVRTPWGRRRPFMFVGGLLTVVCFTLLFHVPPFEMPGARAAYVCAIYTLALTAFSAFSVPYLTMGAEMTPDTHERTRLMAFRVAFMASGLIVSGYAGAVREYGGDGVAGFTFMGWVMGAVCLVTMMTSVVATGKAPYFDRHETSLPLGAQFKLALQNTPFLTLLIATFLQRLGEGTGYASLLYFMAYVLHQSMTMLGTLILSISIGGIITQPLWVAMARHLGKKTTFVVTVLAYCAVFALWLVPRPDQTGLILVISFLCGAINAGFILTALSMLADAIAFDRARTGLNREGAYAGVWLANEKVAFAVGTLLVGVVLSGFGFVETSQGLIAQSDRTLTGIKIAYVIIPIFFDLLSLIFVLRYRLPEVAGREPA